MASTANGRKAKKIEFIVQFKQRENRIKTNKQKSHSSQGYYKNPNIQLPMRGKVWKDMVTVKEEPLMTIPRLGTMTSRNQEK